MPTKFSFRNYCMHSVIKTHSHSNYYADGCIHRT